MNIEQTIDYGYDVKYKNGTLYLTDRRWKYMFDATTLKLGDVRYALKHNNIDSLPWLPSSEDTTIQTYGNCMQPTRDWGFGPFLFYFFFCFLFFIYKIP